MGSIMQAVVATYSRPASRLDNETRSRRVSFSQSVEQIPILKTSTVAKDEADLITRNIPLSFKDENVESILRLLTAWAIFVKRGTLGYVDEEFILALRGSDTTDVHQHRLSELIPSVDETISSCRMRVVASFREKLLTDQTYTFEAARLNDPKVVLFTLQAEPENGTISLITDSRNFSQSQAELYIDTIYDIFHSISDDDTAIVSELMEAQLHEVAQIWKWSCDLPEAIDRPIHEYFMQHAAEGPDRPAVVSWDRQFSYSELDHLSTRLSHKLRGLGLQRGHAVPLCFEKSAWTVLAVLAIIKSGAAFVLTDPSQPETRLTTIVEEVKAQVVLSSTKYTDLGRRIAPNAQILTVDSSLLTELELSSNTTPEVRGGDDPLYIIFTSGSTGKPKGVMISHKNYTSGAIPRAQIVGYGPDTRVLDFASYAFDVSIDCMLLTLATGGCVCVPADDDRLNNLSGAIRKMDVNMVHTTPSIARVFEADVIPSLKVLGLGGEAVPAREAAEWNQHTRVLVAYGPSECTVGCAFARWEEGKTYTSLGRGCGGTLWIVDPEDSNKLSPIGAPGELVVEGAIVGLGYINEPEKTAAAFFEDPKWLLDGFGPHQGRSGRLYKTGDIVKYDPDGSGAVVFVGRKDQQVKIRGQRVELEEVEHHLRANLPAKTAVAAEIISPGGTGDAILAVFVVEHDLKQEQIVNQSVSFSADFREFLSGLEDELRKDVPKYMIPAAYIAMSQIPTTVSGKTDRKQLQAFGSSLSRQELASWKIKAQKPESTRALSDTERVLGLIWQQILHYDAEIRPDDDFFSLGGDSLKAMRLVALTRGRQLRLNIKTIFENSTLESMALKAHAILAHTSKEVAPFSLLDPTWNLKGALEVVAGLCSVSPGDLVDIYPCTPLQEGLIALSAKVDEAYVAQRVVSLPDLETANRLKMAFQLACKDCPILRTRIVYVPDRGLLQVVLRDSGNWHQANDLEEYLATDRKEPIDLGKPLCRFALVQNSTGSAEVVLTIHHALYDGWSMPLVVDRINRAYMGLEPPERTHFKNFIYQYQQQDLNVSEKYWSALLGGAEKRQFPKLPEPSYQTKADCLVEEYISVPKISMPSSTLANVIRGAWVLAAAEYSGHQDIIFGETLTGRNADVDGIEEIEAPLITTIPMRIQFSGETKIRDFLAQIHKQTIDRIPHEHFGLQNIRRLSGDARQACDLRTGLVLHPCEDDNENKIVDGPASGLVPASDSEAAQEALKFNSFALMLVCTLEKTGFLTMASFDSNTVASGDMKDLLKIFAKRVQALIESPDLKLQQVCDFDVATIRPEPENVKAKVIEPGCEFPNGVSEVAADIAVTERLRTIWARILRIDATEIDAHTDFFDLGGDSIGAMKLVSELRQFKYKISVAQIFSHRKLSAMVSLLSQSSPTSTEDVSPENPESVCNHDLHILPDLSTIRPLLAQHDWEIEKIHPARPLQEIAVTGTVKLPRYSLRYEKIYLDGGIDHAKLVQSCVKLVRLNEILRTVFVRSGNACYAVVLKELREIVYEDSMEGDLESFCHSFCDLDIQKTAPYGSNFVKFFLVQETSGRSCLIFRISHAQYDEMCLPVLLRQLSQIYQGTTVEPSLPFSSFVNHIIKDNLPRSTAYWKELLRGSSMQKLPGPQIAISDRKRLISVTKTVSLIDRPKSVTLASFPTAAWALCLARRLSSQDVIFGEVVSGRNTGYDNADQVTGPCWQYIPFRAQLDKDWTGLKLLEAVQEQHITSSQFEGMGLAEIVENCTEWGTGIEWFDSVLHQAVAAVEELPFSMGAVNSKVETYYPHLEPLREWKIQAFTGEKEMTLEVVTFEEWKEFGQSLLDDLCDAFDQLVQRSDEKILP